MSVVTREEIVKELDKAIWGSLMTPVAAHLHKKKINYWTKKMRDLDASKESAK